MATIRMTNAYGQKQRPRPVVPIPMQSTPLRHPPLPGGVPSLWERETADWQREVTPTTAASLAPGFNTLTQPFSGCCSCICTRGRRASHQQTPEGEEGLSLRLRKRVLLFRKQQRRQHHSMLDHLLGLVRVRVVKGVNLAIRDLRSSDPYVVVRIGKQKLKTRVIKKSTNPEWNEELTLSIEDPAVPVRLEVYDKDTFVDDSMGNAEFDIGPLVDVVKMKLQNVPNNTMVKKLVPSRQNCLAEESTIYISEGKVKQDLVIRLKNVESGEIELQLQWVDLPGSKGI